MIIVDTREQLPLWDPINFELIRQKLDEGDYTTEKLLNLAHAERKSAMDFYGSLIQGHKRFSREIQRAIGKDLSFAIFVECTENKFISMRFRGATRLKTKPATLAKIVATFQERYPIKIIWCKDREDMKTKMCFWFLEEEEKLIQ
jgi:ERCC4-type nuclease